MPQTMQSLVEQYVACIKEIYGAHLREVAEPPLIRGLVLDKLVIKLKSKTEYEIIM